MHTRNPSIHLTRGHQTLTITKLSGRYVGLINGKPYIEALPASTQRDHAMTALALWAAFHPIANDNEDF